MIAKWVQQQVGKKYVWQVTKKPQTSEDVSKANERAPDSPRPSRANKGSFYNKTARKRNTKCKQDVTEVRDDQDGGKSNLHKQELET